MTQYIVFDDYPFNYISVRDNISKEKDGFYTSNGKKIGPFTTNWKKYQETRNPNMITTNNRAIITGAYDLDIFPLLSLDIDDVSKDFDPIEFIKHHNLPLTRILSTGSGNYQLLYAIAKKDSYDNIPRNTNSHTQKIEYKGVSMDFRGQGGCIFAPPTKFLNKLQYSWYNDEDIAIVDEDIILQFFDTDNSVDDDTDGKKIPATKIVSSNTSNDGATDLFKIEVKEELTRRIKKVIIPEGDRSRFALALSGFSKRYQISYDECRVIANHNQSIIDVEGEKKKDLIEYSYRDTKGQLAFVDMFEKYLSGFRDYVNDLKIKYNLKKPSRNKIKKWCRTYLRNDLYENVRHFLIEGSEELAYYDTNDHVYKEDKQDYLWIRKKIVKYLMRNDVEELEDPLISRMAHNHKNFLLDKEMYDFHVDFPQFCYDDDDYVYINCNNGVLKISKQDYSKELVTHSQIFRFRSKLDVNWDPKADYSDYLDAAKQILTDNTSRDQLFYYFGYSLLQYDFRPEIMLWAWGSGGNGKSTLIEPFAEIFDEKKVSRMNIYATKQQFDMDVLSKSDFWYASESRKSMDLSTMHKIISGEPISTDRKHRSRIDFKAYLKILVTSNGMPNLYIDADKRRVCMIRFPNKYKQETKDINLKENLINQSEGVFKLAVEYLVKYLKTPWYWNQFDFVDQYNKSKETDDSPFINLYVPARLNEKECDTINVGDGKYQQSCDLYYITIDDLLEDANSWLDKHGYSLMTKTEIGQAMGNGNKYRDGLGYDSKRKTIDGKKQTVYHCLKWKKEEVPNLEDPIKDNQSNGPIPNSGKQCEKCHQSLNNTNICIDCDYHQMEVSQ